ncbi:RT0821/Lpp0805 family surface protein [Hwanghaeella sp.]|uniref:RT0821/Lpp0805 family surface protein n=1 Tax=Hwanghaeella sp. TaxID=2605943 RepID=UPI003CCBA4EB
MKRITRTLLAAGAACALLQGCTGIGTISREDKLAHGAIAGAIVGGALGYEVIGSGSGQLVGLVVGAAVGSGAGYVLADRLTQLDLRTMNKSTYEGLTERPTGETVAWNNPDSGNSGEITPLRTFLSNDGKLCRDYRRTVNVAGEVQHTTHTACRNGRGDWLHV